MSLKKLIDLNHNPNIANDLDTEELLKLGTKASDEFKYDKQSRAEWESNLERILKIAKQVYEQKTFPWVGAANVKYPLLTDAAIKFASRQYPQIVQGTKIVRCAVVADDPMGDLADSAERISQHMSSQLLIESNTWETVMDKLLHIYPIVGTVFKKIYYDPIERQNKTDLCTPDAIVINNHVKDINEARRISHIIYKHANYITGMMNLGLYKEYDLKEFIEPNTTLDEDHLFELVEQHRYIDLDDDGYQEPYIVTFHRATSKILRIAPCWDMKNVYMEGNDVVYIKPIRYFVDYHFIPAPDGSYYSLGYGQLLLPINETINGVINQLLDSGTLANTQGGFIQKGVRIKNGKIEIKQGDWNIIDSPANTLKDAIMPFPVREPSPTLLKLLELMIQTGKELASISEIIEGQQSGNNVTATTTTTLLQQSLVVPTAVQKRMWRSLKEEFECIAYLNQRYMDTFKDFMMLGKNYRIYKADYQKVGLTIEPVADPNAASDSIRVTRAAAIMQTIPLLNSKGKQQALEMFYKSLNISEADVKQLLAPAQDPPSPEMIKAETDRMSVQLQGQSDMLDKQLKHGKLVLEQQAQQMEAIRTSAEIEKDKAAALLALIQAQDGAKGNHLDRYIKILNSLGSESPREASKASDIMDTLEEDRPDIHEPQSSDEG